MINSWCAELCKTITALQTCWVQEITDSGEKSYEKSDHNSSVPIRKINQTREQPPRRIHEAPSSKYDPNDDQTSSYLPPGPHIVSKLCLGNILTSHLTSFGSSIVVGNDCLAVNKVCVLKPKRILRTSYKH